ncbi:MAG: aldo/keto reductase [Clostridia bacterium]|nr:aldo/keto reductase [Clostridia bacterium]
MGAKKLGFGTMRLPVMPGMDYTHIDMNEFRRMADMFIERGFTYFDAAWMYHDGEAERALKKVLAERYPRDAYTVTTKMPTMMLSGPDDQVRYFETQLERTGLDYFDYYLAHNLNVDTYGECLKYGTLEYMRDLKSQGRIKHLGFSFHDSPEFLEMLLQKYPEMEYVQLQLNYLDWDNESIQSRKCYETARKYGKQIIVMEPVKGGTLANLTPEAEQILKAIHPDWSKASWAIRFAASLPGVMTVLSGMTTLEQMNDNTSYMQDFAPLTENEVEAVFKVRDIIIQSKAIPCTRCRYCVEANSCPMDIPIPDFFALYNTETMCSPNGWTQQWQYYSNMVSNGKGRASACISCHGCESVCPQHIQITEWLKKVSAIFEA